MVRRTRSSAGKKSIYRGVVDYVQLEIKNGAKYGTRLNIGEKHSDYQRTKLAIGFVGDDGCSYWFRAPEVNLPLQGDSPVTDWLSRGTQVEHPEIRISKEDRIAVSGAVKATETKHGTQLYFVTRLSDDGEKGSQSSDRLTAIEKRLGLIESRLGL